MRNPFGVLFERRSIGSSYDLMQYLLKGVTSLAGQDVNESTAFNIAAVMTCVSIRARALASLPCRVYERLDERNKKPALTHPLNRVLLQPNKWQTRFELFHMLETHRVLRGNAYAWENRVLVPSADGVERNQLQELIPMHPDRIELLEQTDELDGQAPTYRLHRRRGGHIDLPANEVLHLKGLSTDGRTGRSVLTDARELIGSALATQEHSSTFWRGHAVPDIALRHPKTLSPKAKENLEKSWEATYGAGKDKRRVAVLEEGLDIEKLAITAQDAQFLETRKFQRAEIAGWFHVPPHMIGDTEKSTSWGTGIEQQQIGFLVFTLRPDLVAWEQRLTRDLITRTDKYFVEFSLEGTMRGDAVSRGQFYRVMREIGAYSANDVRALENLNPIGEVGDIYLQPTNLAPLGYEPPSKPAPATGATE